MDAAFGHLLTFDGERFDTVAVHGETHVVEHLRQRGPFRPPLDRLNLLRRIVAGDEHFVQVADVLETDEYPTAPGFRDMVDIGGYRTLLNVALRKENVLLGVIVIFRKETRLFSDKQIALLQNFAAQAVIAMENARLLTETREALEQQTATAEVLQVINSSPGDLAPVFDAMLDKAMQSCTAAFGILWTYDGEYLHAVAHRGVPPAYVEFISSEPHLADLDPLTGRFLSGERFVYGDVAASEAYHTGNPFARALVDLGGGRSMLSVPLRKDDVLLGLIVMYWCETRLFEDKQIALLQNFAAQAVIAMENARLITETREALEQQTATAEVLGVINSSPGDLAPVFDVILEKAHALCGAAGGALTIADGEYFRAVGTHGIPQAFSEILHRPFHLSRYLQQRLLRGDGVAHIADLTDPEFSSDEPIHRAAVDLGGVRTLLMVPLCKDGALLGYFTASHPEVRPFTDKQIALIQNFGAQAVIAMENARLITETREALERQTATAEVLQVINSSPGDLKPVFDAMLEKATRLCEAPFGTLRTWDGESFHFGAVYGDPQLSDWVRRRGSFRPDGGPLKRIMEGEQVIQVADASRDADYPASPGFKEMVAASGMRSGIVVALRKDEALLGSIHVYRQEVRPFTDKQIALLQSFAAQAVIAMENARLLDELRQRTDQVAGLNRGLEARVAEQVEELGRVGRLKRFLAPQLAELIVSQGDERILESHRREIVVVFCDLRGYTAFTETAEPEEVLDFLREYHGALGPLVAQFEGTLDQFSGDGIMVFFNDPVPIPDPAERAVKMAMAMRETASALISGWRRLGRDLGFGAGIAQGYATLGQIGFSERSGYTAIGTVCNVAARLCAEAKDGQILISQRVAARLDDDITLEDIGSLTLKGLMQPVSAFNVPLAAGQASLRVIEGGPQSV